MNKTFMDKRKKLLCLLLCAACLTGCSAQPAASVPAAATLPPVQTRYSAPAGSEAELTRQTVTLYLPAADGHQLLAQYAELTLSHAENPAERVVNALLSYRANEQVTTLGGPIALTLYGDSPVHTAGGICTVNLGTAALQLEKDRFYTVCLALASTLCALNGIHSVNVLVAGHPIGLDITENLPLGLVSAHPGEALAVLWSQMEAKCTPLGEDPAGVPLSANAALYFPLESGEGFVAESRSITFEGQTPAQLVDGLLGALSVGALYADGTADMPDLHALQRKPARVTDLEDGGRVVTLYFPEDLELRLGECAIDTAAFVSALVYTIGSFVPAVTAVEVMTGAQMLRRLYSESYGLMQMADGRMRAADFTRHLYEQVTIELAREDRLTRVARYVPAGEAASMRTLIDLLSRGPTGAEQADGLSAVLPDGIYGEDVLGIAIRDDLLLLNLPASAAELIRSAPHERLLCYALINTLCEQKNLRRAVIFFDGEQFETLAGDICWSGEFLYAPGLIADELG